MGKTVNFFHIAIFKDGEKTDIDLLRFLDDISAASWENKVRKIDGDITAAFPFYFNGRHMDKRIIPFGKFRIDYKPFVGNIAAPILREIQNDVIELITMVYDQMYKVAVLDFNINGLRVKSIEQYLTSFLPRIPGQVWEVKLIPIVQRKDIEDIRRSNQVRYVEIKLKLNKYDQNFLNRNVQAEEDLLLNLLSNFPQSTEEIDANIIKIEFASNNGKGTTINIEAVLALLQQLNLEHDYIDSIKVRYRDSRTTLLDTIDLKDIGRQMKTRILDDDPNTNPASEYVGNTIIERYDQFAASLSASHIDFIADMQTIERPQLQLVPRAENVVEHK